jgi:hypothetical protein
VSSAAQTELGFVVVQGGSYEVEESKATWRSLDEKTIKLSFGGKEFTVTREGRGVAGNPRFHVNGYTQPDGKLLQGRSIPELVRKLHRFGKAIIRRVDRLEANMHARFDRLEKMASGKAPRVVGQSKLCAAPVRVEWEQRRYIPRNAAGSFARVPEPLIDGSRSMASGEYRLIQAILILAQGTGLLTAGKYRLADLAKVDPADVKRCRDSLVNRGILRPTGRKLPRGLIEYELLTHPFLMAGDLSDAWGEESGTTGGKNVATGGTVPPNKTSQKKNPKDESRARPQPPSSDGSKRTRAQLSDEEKRKRGDFAVSRELTDDDLWRQLFDAVGAPEMHDNGRNWSIRHALERDTIATILQDFRSSQKTVNSPSAWFQTAWLKSPAGKRELNRRRQAQAQR